MIVVYIIQAGILCSAKTKSQSQYLLQQLHWAAKFLFQITDEVAWDGLINKEYACQTSYTLQFQLDIEE